MTLLLPPGAESHSYEPTPADILRVQRCDLFLYLGGESDAWVDAILSAIEPRGEALRMIDCVDLLEEETVEGMQGGHDHDHDHEEGTHEGSSKVKQPICDIREGTMGLCSSNWKDPVHEM